MTDHAAFDAGSQRRVRQTLLALCVVVVTHGSLYPWLFAAPASWDTALRQMFVERLWWTGRGDAAVNVLLFLPVGLFGWLAVDRAEDRWTARARRVLGPALGWAFVLQGLQLWIPERPPAVSDALWNGVGIVLGMPLARIVRPGVDRLAELRFGRHRIACVLGLLWVVVQGWPWMPSHSLRHALLALQPMWRWPAWEAKVVCEAAISLAAVLVFAQHMRRRWLFACGLVACALVARLQMRHLQLSPSHVAGWLFGLTCGAAAWRAKPRDGAATLVALVTGWLALDGLHPFDWRGPPTPFHWIPLWASLQSARVAHTQVLVQALFWTGTLVAAARLLGLPLTRTVAVLALWMFAIEVTQQWVPGQLADIAPVLFPVFWWWLWGRWLASPSSLHL
jgi:VanZ family protein